MTPEQFEVIAKLLRSQEHVANAVRRVLVEGCPPSEAAREGGISPQSMSNALSRYRAAHEDIAAAYPGKKADDRFR
ncbi:TrfB-related DNA-binding protein [Pandoraea apista]|uniref:TrfB-related DNA-binding protein n=1 Tax=Pandoraea apista TaxID=93218 RepID=UPI00058AA097|nr:hypothetical protein SG18_02165 [Pandoraea apista]AKH71236.1 hypothetical protein XM39_02165 [Pandoraea apista]AKI63508.1 hypothetical protein AA956_19485 [Pandoraea apista]